MLRFESGADFNVQDDSGSTILHEACVNWNSEATHKIIFDFEVDVNLENKNSLGLLFPFDLSQQAVLLVACRWSGITQNKRRFTLQWWMIMSMWSNFSSLNVKLTLEWNWTINHCFTWLRLVSRPILSDVWSTLAMNNISMWAKP